MSDNSSNEVENSVQSPVHHVNLNRMTQDDQEARLEENLVQHPYMNPNKLLEMHGNEKVQNTIIFGLKMNESGNVPFPRLVKIVIKKKNIVIKNNVYFS
ncbi:hypothetical protein TNCT_567511 [Trichonephila clavata]|uniref:Uncharacterized protein n=1 Tax=Trichonephila clavata TaxID=2740835 RepID=A0A8X6H971_TRICU|nr:hypothetical protein TNCT_567511 [Trichonephila clavata]